MIRVIVVDDHAAFRAELIASITLEDDISVVGEGGSGDDAVVLTGQLLPDIVLLDVNMPGGGIGRIGEILHIHPKSRVIMVSASSDPSDMENAKRAGASGYLLKGSTGSKLRDLVRSVYDGKV